MRILVADDDQLVRKSLVQEFQREEDMQIVGEACDGQEAITKALELKPDVIVMDIYMPILTGVEATAVISSKLPTTRVLMLTVSESGEDILQALQVGTSGYITKSSDLSEIIKAVRRTAAGETVISVEMAQRLAAALRAKPDKGPAKLSDREAKVLELAGEGLTDRQIGLRMSIGENTVGTYMARVFKKLNVKSRAEAVAYISRLAKLKSRGKN
jgi:DNA-binding NarL/FixJ family response regulator